MTCKYEWKQIIIGYVLASVIILLFFPEPATNLLLYILTILALIFGFIIIFKLSLKKITRRKTI